MKGRGGEHVSEDFSWQVKRDETGGGVGGVRHVMG